MTDAPEQEGERERRINEALAEYFRQSDDQGPVGIDEFVAQHGDLAGELRELLEAVDLIERMAGPVLPSQSAEDNNILPIEQAEESKDAAADDSPAETLPFSFQKGNATRETTTQDLPAKGLAFGDYCELEKIGQGGMGVVYRARQVSLDRVVAIKMIRSGVLASDRDVERFRSEAQAAGKLHHPNIVKIYQVDEIDGQYFYSMEYVDGIDLAELNRREELNSRRIARYVREIAAAIHHAHEQGVVHRDLKPANILIDQQDRPLVTDFGLAKNVSREQGLTSSGSSLGTPSYMSPEQAAGRLDVGVTSDVYSIGAILYELLTGRPPFRANSTVDTILEVIHKAPVAPRSINGQADKQLEAICLKCLQKDAGQRYATARELADDLGRYLDDVPVLARPVGLLSRCGLWLRDVPLVAAIIGRHVTNPTLAHRVTQWLVVGVAMLLMALPFLSSAESPYPPRVRIAAGDRFGEYYRFSHDVCEILRERQVSAQVLETDGSVANLQRLLAEDADAGMLQASVVSPFPDGLAVVAPLYQDHVHFIVSVDSHIDNLSQFEGQRVIVGKRLSGMQQSASQIVHKLGINIDVVYKDFRELEQGAEMAAIVTTGLDNPSLRSLLQDRRFRLLPLDSGQLLQLAEMDVFRPQTIHAGSLGNGIPAADLPTVSTTTYLVVHKRASSQYVTDLLDAISELTTKYGLKSLHDRAEWGPFPLHPAAKAYFDRKAAP